jgi:hypothetical protein
MARDGDASVDLIHRVSRALSWVLQRLHDETGERP